LADSPVATHPAALAGPGVLKLMTLRPVQDELMLTDEQGTKSTALCKELNQKYREDLQHVLDAHGGEEELNRKIAELTKTINAEFAKSLADLLVPEQIKRFNQIELQSLGVNAFLTPGVQTALQLTDAQKHEIKNTAEGWQGEVRVVVMGSSEYSQEKMTSLRKSGVEKILSSLTTDQKKRWIELIGEPFDLKPARSPDRGRGQ
jgi:hypothetical protein